VSPVSGQKNEKILDAEEVGCCKTLVTTWLTPWYYTSDDSNLQNTIKSHSTGRTISLVLPVYIPVVYVPYYIRFSKWNWRLKRDYWLPNYATISACRKADSVQKLCSEINIKRIWLKEKWRMKWNSKSWLHYCTIELREADHLLSSTAKATWSWPLTFIYSQSYVKLTTYFHLQPKLRASKLYLHSPIRLHSVRVNQTQDEVTSQYTPGLHR